jgi:hypothetical protein
MSVHSRHGSVRIPSFSFFSYPVGFLPESPFKANQDCVSC